MTDIDITRDLCPMTYVRTRLALDKLRSGELLRVLLRGEEPRRNVPQTAAEQGHTIVSMDDATDGTTTPRDPQRLAAQDNRVATGPIIAPPAATRRESGSPIQALGRLVVCRDFEKHRGIGGDREDGSEQITRNALPAHGWDDGQGQYFRFISSDAGHDDPPPFINEPECTRHGHHVGEGLDAPMFSVGKGRSVEFSQNGGINGGYSDQSAIWRSMVAGRASGGSM